MACRNIFLLFFIQARCINTAAPHLCFSAFLIFPLFSQHIGAVYPLIRLKYQLIRFFGGIEYPEYKVPCLLLHLPCGPKQGICAPFQECVMLRYISFPCLRFCSPQLRCESIGFFIGTVQGISFSMGNQAEFLFLPSQALRVGKSPQSPSSRTPL